MQIARSGDSSSGATENKENRPPSSTCNLISVEQRVIAFSEGGGSAKIEVTRLFGYTQSIEIDLYRSLLEVFMTRSGWFGIGEKIYGRGLVGKCIADCWMNQCRALYVRSLLWFTK